jgi:hypothetical protein
MTKTIQIGHHCVHIIEADSGFTVKIGTTNDPQVGVQVAKEGRRFLAGVAVNAVVNTLTAVALLKRPAMMLQGKN